jgi:hypothetical protein
VTIDQLGRAIRWLDRGLWVMLVVNLGFLILRLWQRDAGFVWNLLSLVICCLGLARVRRTG